MPTYEYKCTQDNSTFEIWQEVGAAAPSCPTCGAPSKKVFSPVRTIFKGSGFYLTDTRAEQAAKSGGQNDSNSEKSSDKPASEGQSSDSKSPTTTPSAPAPAPSSASSSV